MNSEMMAKLRGLIEEAATDKCNMTAEGTMCPVHENEKCPEYVEEVAPAGMSDELAAKKIAAKLQGTPDLNIPKIKQYVTKYLGMVGKAPTDVDHLAALVHTELGNKGVMETKKNKKPDADGDGVPDWADKKPGEDDHAGKKPKAKKGEMSAKQAKYFGKKTVAESTMSLKDILASSDPLAASAGTEHEELVKLMHHYDGSRWYNPLANNKTASNTQPMSNTAKAALPEDEVDEDMHITVDGAEAQDMINRLMALAGHEGMPTVDAHGDMCDDCGCTSEKCTCNSMTPASFGPDGISMEENIDHDYGHTAHSDMGEPVDPDTYMYKAPVGNQRMVKGIMGDNPLIKEDADALSAKLKKDYKRYVAEAELARSNAGDLSPLSNDNREKFDIDPFAGESPVTDGSRSPLSTIKRQKINK